MDSWPSILGFVFALLGYILIGRKSPIGWLCSTAANTFLVITGIVTHQVGLLGSAFFASIAMYNYFKWRRSDKVIQASN